MGSSSTSTRHPDPSARAISTSCCPPARAAPRASRAGCPGDRAARAHPLPVSGRRRAARRPIASVRRRARCSPSRSGAAPATGLGRSSRPRRVALRAAMVARRTCRRASSHRRRAGALRTGSLMSVLLPAPFCPTSAHTSPAWTSRSTPASATVWPKALRTPRIAKRGGAPAVARSRELWRDRLAT